MVSMGRRLRHWKDLHCKAFQALRFLFTDFLLFPTFIYGAFMIPKAPDLPLP